MKPLTRLERMLAVLFPATFILLLLTTISYGMLLAFFYQLQQTGFADAMRAQRLDEIHAFISVFSVGVRVVTGIVFLYWLYRAISNLRHARLPEFFLKPGTAVVEYFVPLLNFFGPIVSFNTLWSGTQFLLQPEKYDSWSDVKPSPRIVWWWLLFIGGNMLMTLGSRIPNEVPSVAPLITSAWLGLAGTVLLLPSAALAINLVRQISAWHRALRKQLAEEAGVVVH